MSLEELNTHVGSLLCSISCQESRDAKRGVINHSARYDMLMLSICIKYSRHWSPEKIEKYRCYLFEKFGPTLNGLL